MRGGMRRDMYVQCNLVNELNVASLLDATKKKESKKAANPTCF